MAVELLPCEGLVQKVLSPQENPLFPLISEVGFSGFFTQLHPLPGHRRFWAIKRARIAPSQPWLPCFIWKHSPLEWLITHSAPPSPSQQLFSSFLISTAMTGQLEIPAQLQPLIPSNPFFLLVVISAISSTISPSLNLSMNKWKMVK